MLCKFPRTPTRVLVVEDDRLFADGLATTLEREGYEVQTAYTGDEALARAFEYRPDLVLMDLRLPGQSGFLVAAKLRIQFNPPRVICMTGLHRGVSDRLAAYVHADAVLHKPFNVSRLLQTVRSVLAAQPLAASA